MTYMDKQNRLAITENIREVSTLNFEKEIRIFLLTKNDTHYLVLSNDKNLKLPCFGIVNFDPKHRFYIPKELRKYLNLTHETALLVYSMRGNLVIKKL